MASIAQPELKPHEFIENGFLYPYPRKDFSDSWPMWGWESQMVDMALRNDDPVAFVYFMRKCGLDNRATTFDGLSMRSYCEKRNAKACKKILSEIT